MVNNGDDGGRQIQPDYYQQPQNYTQNGKVPEPVWANNGYNTTLGGDYARNTVTLLEYYQITNGYYIKFRPIFWGFAAEISQITIEVTYVLTGNAVKATYKYTSSRTDNQIPNGITINGWALPAVYLNQNFSDFYTYTGNNPYSNDTVSHFVIPSTGSGEANSKEFWGASINPSTGIGVGVFNRMPNRTDTYFRFLKHVTGGDTNSEFSLGLTLIEALETYNTPDSHVEWNRTDTAYLIVGNVPEIRNKVYQIYAS